MTHPNHPSVDQSDRVVPYNLRQSGRTPTELLISTRVRKSPFWHLSHEAGCWRATSNTPFFPHGKTYQGYNLSKWVATQNRQLNNLDKWKKQDTKMRKERERKLRKLGFPLPNKLDYGWEQMYKFAKLLLVKYKGRIPVKNPDTDKPYKLNDEVDLKTWITKQRGRYEQGKLKQERIEKLENLKYWSWNPFKDTFEKNYALLIEYITKKKNPNPQQDTKYKGCLLYTSPSPRD